MRTKSCVAILALAGVLLSGAAAADSHEKAIEKVPEELSKYTRTGDVQDCLQTYLIRSANVLDDRHIIFETRGGDYYLNQLPHRCPQLGFEERFGYTLRGPNRLCHVDFITVLTTTGPGASCGLGKFEKLEKVEKKPTQ
ncbi:MAG: hypothetical protein D6763_06955 [Alphaproteobacteria bacterium]|nr:MAG: hypothetical protein D6763_06955 [Alphaproteobacteria bacterium]